MSSMRGWSSIEHFPLGEANISCYSQRSYSQIGQIYAELRGAFWYRTDDRVNRALEAMKHICSLSKENGIAIQSYQLFCTIMETQASPAFSEEKKWEASRLALHVAYKWDEALPPL